MTLQQLKYIIEIVNCGSITEGAKHLFISQPSLSNSVHELENELGITIFVRTAKGISLTSEGTEFLQYARQVIEQSDLLEQRYKKKNNQKQIFSVSTQHYSFSVNAFVNLIKAYKGNEYEFTLRETKTYEIIEDVKSFKSEIGILYINDFNRNVINRFLKENHLIFTPVFTAKPHVFISDKHPLAQKRFVTLDELEDYPVLLFEQGNYNSFFFSEEILSTLRHKKTIFVSDRATLFNLLVGLNGYTICTGVIDKELNGDNITAVPLNYNEKIQVGYITNEKAKLSLFAEQYISQLKQLIEMC